MATIVFTSGCYLSHGSKEDAFVPSDGGAPDGSGAGLTCDAPPSTYDALCCDFTDAVCDVLESCCGSMPTFDRTICEERVLPTCTQGFLGDWVRERVETGVIEFDADAMRRWVENGQRVMETSCTWMEMWNSPGIVRDVVTLFGTFRGTKEPGERCSVLAVGYEGYPTECRGGFCDQTISECVEYVGRGEACGRNHRCLDLDHPIQPVAGAPEATALRITPLVPEQPYARLRCVSDRCLDRLEVGAACATDDECESLRCDGGACAALAPLGAFCEDNDDCESHFCTASFVGRRGTCEPGDLPLGSRCGLGPQCASDACYGRCVLPMCFVSGPFYRSDR